MVYAKGVFSLIVAMEEIKKYHGNVKLILLGTGENDRVCAMIKRGNLEEIIHAYCRFLDHKEVLGSYLLADVCIFPSLYEPFGFVALEAMSLGKPVILGNGFPKMFGGNPDAPNVLYVDGRNFKSISDAILQLLNNNVEAVAMGKRGQDFVNNTFDWGKCLKKHT